MLQLLAIEGTAENLRQLTEQIVPNSDRVIMNQVTPLLSADKNFLTVDSSKLSLAFPRRSNKTVDSIN